ncbi:MAG: DUF1549 domain-containing protein, partial [Verrucomicrobiales bacterium]|nr:DUF1549 domain-containing protein [Verrucomicrobiales bacterium]
MKPLLAALVLGVAVPLSAATIDYSRTIQPLLAEHCFHCHGKDPATRKGGLRLDEREAALRGGKSDGPALVPGQPDKSALLARITTHDAEDLMPPPEEKKPVTSADVAKLRQWILEGAAYSGHWAFEAPVKAALPAGAPDNHPVDAFVLDRLKREGLSPSPEADPETLCRRLHLDLIGLPPAIASVDAVVRDAAAKGLAATTAEWADTLMKDRRFGEKWARHWLDVARYSDSNGFEKDLPREQWTWRDWVIRAWNDDMPYDRFVVEQIAGDLLPNPTQDQIVATGFLRNSMINEEGAIVPEEWRLEAMFDRMDAVGSGILGVSLKCAQCHAHKFDPISQGEYYGVFAFLNNTYEAQSWVHTEEQRQAIAKIREGIGAVEDRLRKEHPDWEKRMAAWETAELERWRRTSWTPIDAEDTHSSSELNHPTVLPDKSILTLGHRTISGDVHILASPRIENVTGLRLEILKHDDLPFGGPGRSFRGTWALTEFV